MHRTCLAGTEEVTLSFVQEPVPSMNAGSELLCQRAARDARDIIESEVEEREVFEDAGDMDHVTAHFQ